MTAQRFLRLGAFEFRSRVNGPGVRAVIWTQGCPRRCPGCCNPEFQDPTGGAQIAIQDLLVQIEAAAPVHGITLSGGEPFEQPVALAELCRQVHQSGLTVVCFTGHTLEDLRQARSPEWQALLAEIDLLIAGPYLREQPCEEPLRASANQRVHFLTGRIAPEELEGLPRAEVTIRDGELHVSGFHPELSELLRTRLEGEENADA